MKLTKLPAQAGPVLNFYEEALGHLGAVCDRPWHDRLEVLAEGPAAALWRADGELHSAALHFPEPDEPGPRDAATQVFPGCPLTFRLVETLWQQRPPQFHAVLEPGLEGPHPPAPAVAEKIWHNQFGQSARVDASRWERQWHFSLVASVRCAIQAIDQTWTCHRLGLALASGDQDPHLESEFDYFSFLPEFAEPIGWPALPAVPWPDWLGRALATDLREELAAVRKRQERYLERELRRLDEYFDHYEQELTARLQRQAKPESRSRYQDRLRATQIEHARRRDDQVKRHEVRVRPAVDALLLIAETAWQTQPRGRHGEPFPPATYVPRARRWF